MYDMTYINMVNRKVKTKMNNPIKTIHIEEKSLVRFMLKC